MVVYTDLKTCLLLVLDFIYEGCTLTKARRSLWTENDMELALREVILGTLTQRAASVKYNIPRRTLRDYLKAGSVENKKNGRLSMARNSIIMLT